MCTELTFEITFGDCDPAGIVFYPNIFRWMDAAFHAHLRQFGGHEVLCKKLNAVGFGLVDASAQFRHPMRDGDRLEVRIMSLEWSRRTLTVAYEGTIAATTTFLGKEVRCLFSRSETGMVATDLSQIRMLLEPGNV
ncbi:acyl-CoA thioesterase [Sedimentitalea sp. XS_ASV28]|uniref:acyl-CoA thioesterase n=1 Tax=Sedimentitalea sp. XS_ASV28 TaxID=3241296 RepID=UPI0035138760